MPDGTVIITGGSGFVGRHLVRELQQEWPQSTLHVWDTVDAEQSGVVFTGVDITKPETFAAKLEEVKPDWLVHLAGIAAVPRALEDPDLVKRVNVEGTRHVLAALKDRCPEARSLVVSSADLYGLSSEEAQKELALDEATPRNPYAESKLEMERVIEEHFESFVVRARPYAHLGPGQGLGFVAADFASQIAAIEAGAQDARLAVGNLEARRDFTDVRDVVRAYRLLMEQGELGEVYHVASGKAVRVRDLLDGLLGLASVPIEIEVDQNRLRPSDIPVVIGDAGKLRLLTGWEPTIALEDSLKAILEDWRQRVRENDE